MKTRNSNLSLPIISFILPITLLVVTYYLLGITPFGEMSLLTIDLNGQYISYFAYLKDSALNLDNLMYSFSKTMSGEMIGLTGYYLLSPFNIIFLLFEVENFPLAITIITLLKVGTIGLSMSYLLKEKRLSSLVTIMLSTIYSLSSYTLVYQQNIMWLDSVILLPIMILGIDKIFARKGKNIYIISLAIAIITNYYIGYMMCIFSAIYFVTSFVEKSYLKTINEQDKSKFHKVVLNYIGSSLLSVGLSAFILIPTLYSLKGGKANLDFSSIITFDTNFSLIQFLSKFIIGAFSFSQVQSGLPNIYVSYFALISSILFFFNKNLSIGIRLKYFIILIFLYLSFKFTSLNLVWHGFNAPNWFPYRYSFFFSFILIMMSAYYLTNPSITKKSVIILGITIIITVLLIWNKNFEYLNTTKIILSLIIIALWLIMMITDMKIKWKLSFLLLVFELLLNSSMTLKENDYRSGTNFSNFVIQNETIIKKIKPLENDFYRVEKNYIYSVNDPLLLNYPGLSHYSSNEKDFVKGFLGNMGYRNNGNWARYGYGSSIFSDSFMGVKYLVSDYKIPTRKNIESNKNVYIYENQYAFPLGFRVGNSQNLSDEITNTFEFQNDLINNLFDLKKFHKEINKESVIVKTKNLIKIDNANTKFHYKKINSEDEAYIEYNLIGLEGKIVNFYFPTYYFYGAEIYIDGEKISRQLEVSSNSVGWFLATENMHTLSIKLVNNDIMFSEELFFYNDANDLEVLFNEAKENELKISKIDSTEIEGDLPNSEEDYLMALTIPYDSGWKATIDGNEAETVSVQEALLGIKITKGASRINLKFVPEGLYVGSLISLICLIIFSLNIIYNRKRIK